MGTPFTSLPQYDLPFLQAETDAWWQGIARHLRHHGLADVPEDLTRSDDNEANWRNPNLLLTQTCGYPLMTELLPYLQAIATPLYDCAGCDGPTYSSPVIVRADAGISGLEDLRGRRVAVNNWNSHSGMNALRHLIAPLTRLGEAFFSEVVLSGGHALSVDAVREGRADVAAIDSVTWALLGRNRPQAVAGLAVLNWTRSAPSLPYAMRVDAPGDLVARVQAALIDAADDPDLAMVRGALLIRGFQPSDTALYQAMLDMRAEAEALGYPVIR